MCLASQREMSRIRRSSACCSGLMDVCGDEGIVTDGRDAGDRQTDRPGQRGDETGALAGDPGRNEQEHLVDEVCGEKRPGERRAAFEQERLDVLGRKPAELLLERPGQELELGA